MLYLKVNDLNVYQCTSEALINIKIINFLIKPETKKYMEKKYWKFIFVPENVVLTK